MCSTHAVPHSHGHHDKHKKSISINNKNLPFHTQMLKGLFICNPFKFLLHYWGLKQQIITKNNLGMAKPKKLIRNNAHFASSCTKACMIEHTPVHMHAEMTAQVKIVQARITFQCATAQENENLFIFWIHRYCIVHAAPETDTIKSQP